jgi:hypothetical protein
VKRADVKKRLSEVEAKLNKMVSDDKLVDVMSTSTKATVGVGGAAIGTEILYWTSDGMAWAGMAMMFGRVFHGLVIVDVVLGLYLLHRRMKKRNDYDMRPTDEELEAAMDEAFIEMDPEPERA